VGEQRQSNSSLFSSSLECVPGEPFEPEVDWEGYVENSVVEIAAQRLRIRTPRADSPGFVLFGSGPRLPEPTEPNHGWPCPDMGGGYPLPGFPYTIEKATITDFRMVFRIAAYEAMDAWCALHGESTMTPGAPDGVCESPVQVAQQGDGMYLGAASMLCSYCSCDSAGCRTKAADEPLFTTEDGIYYTFDIGIDGDRADGSIRNLRPDISGSLGASSERARFHRP